MLIGVILKFQGALNPGERNRSARFFKKDPTMVEEPITMVEEQLLQEMTHGRSGSCKKMPNLPGFHGAWPSRKAQGMMLKEVKTLGVSIQLFYKGHPGGQVPELQSQPSSHGTRLETATQIADVPR